MLEILHLGREMLSSLLACIVPQDESMIEFGRVKADLETSLIELKPLRRGKHELCIKKVSRTFQSNCK
jgi:hypothetical protein